MKKIFEVSYKVLLIIGIFLILNNNIRKTAGNIYEEIRFIKNHIFLDYDGKMRQKWGKYYDYMMFIKNNTPENAVIAVPPNAAPWFTTGNGSLDYYFLYPRIPANSDIGKLPNDSSLNYVMFVRGDSTDDKKTQWPNFYYKAKKIIYYPSKTYLSGWGLIELKK